MDLQFITHIRVYLKLKPYRYVRLCDFFCRAGGPMDPWVRVTCHSLQAYYSAACQSPFWNADMVSHVTRTLLKKSLVLLHLQKNSKLISIRFKALCDWPHWPLALSLVTFPSHFAPAVTSCLVRPPGLGVRCLHGTFFSLSPAFRGSVPAPGPCQTSCCLPSFPQGPEAEWEGPALPPKALYLLLSYGVFTIYCDCLWADWFPKETFSFIFLCLEPRIKSGILSEWIRTYWMNKWKYKGKWAGSWL